MSIEHGYNAIPADNYLNYPKGWKTWLLTLDHKRIGVMYFAAIMFFFFVGGLLAIAAANGAACVPRQDLMNAETYNRIFTLHGAIMIFLFIIPSIPAALGNFVLPTDDRGQGCRVSAAQSDELVHFCVRRAVLPVFDRHRRRRHRLDILYAVQHEHDDLGGVDDAGGVHSRILVDFHRAEFHRHDPQAARSRE